MKPLTKKGMTILEAIIGMTVLIVITISVINLSLSATKASNNNVLAFRASNQAIDYIEIFQEAESEEHFFDLIKNIFKVELVYENNGSVSFIYNGVTSNLFYVQNVLIIECYSGSSDDMVLYEYSYRK